MEHHSAFPAPLRRLRDLELMGKWIITFPPIIETRVWGIPKMNEGNAAAQLPRWQSHKIVSGDKIVEIRQVDTASRTGMYDSGHRWVLACGVTLQVTLDLAARPGPQNPLGGYYVLYENGFESWSPAEAFEKGYTRIGE